MRFAGCAATSHEIAAAFGGDDIVVRARGDLIDPAVPAEAMGFLAGLGVDAERLQALGGIEGVIEAEGRGRPRGLRGRRDPGRPPAAAGGGGPRGPGRLRAVRRPRPARPGRAGENVETAARFAAVGYAAVMFDAVAGGAAAHRDGRPVVRARARPGDRGGLPGRAGRVAADRPPRMTCGRRWSTPSPSRGATFADDAALDEALAGFGDAADLKSPWFTGHSRGVARLARAAAQRLRLEPADAALVYRAGLVHDLGRVAVPAGVWERPGPLRTEDWDLVRLHPYHTGRILARSPALAPLGQIAGRHHERTDGSGYPAGVGASELDRAACLLAAADVLQALGEPRPHRPALDPADASRVMSGLPLDRDAVRAVLDAAARPRPRCRRCPPT